MTIPTIGKQGDFRPQHIYFLCFPVKSSFSGFLFTNSTPGVWNRSCSTLRSWQKINGTEKELMNEKKGNFGWLKFANSVSPSKFCFIKLEKIANQIENSVWVTNQPSVQFNQNIVSEPLPNSCCTPEIEHGYQRLSCLKGVTFSKALFLVSMLDFQGVTIKFGHWPTLMGKCKQIFHFTWENLWLFTIGLRWKVVVGIILKYP